MAIEQFHTATQRLRNQITFTVGTVADIEGVGVYHNVDPNIVPEISDFTMVSLIDGVGDAANPLAEPNKIDIVSLVGSKGGNTLVLSPGDYQRWSLVQTVDEDIIDKLDTITIV